MDKIKEIINKKIIERSSIENKLIKAIRNDEFISDDIFEKIKYLSEFIKELESNLITDFKKDEFIKLINKFNKDIICSVSVAEFIKYSFEFKAADTIILTLKDPVFIGKIENISFYIDTNLKYNDLDLYSKEDRKILLNLKDIGYDLNDII